jgi:adenine phosphoribosyltransferase
MNKELLLKNLRNIPDFPIPGIQFKDVTSLFKNPECLREMDNALYELYKDQGITKIVGIESRGFVFAAPLAERLGIPLILIRKKGKLPGQTYSCKYALEYGTAEIEVHKADIKPNQKILVIDDLIATGGTLKASQNLIEQGGATVAEFFGIVGLPFLKYEEVLNPVKVTTLLNYHGE